MYVYYVLMTVLSVCSIIEVMCRIDTGRRKQKKRNILSVLAYISFLLVLILHHEDMGVDSGNYYIKFELARSVSWTELFRMEGIDYGYYALNKIIGYFTQDFWMVRGVIHSITLLILFFVIDKKSKYPATSVLIYAAMCNFYTFYILREALAISLCFLAYYYLEKKNFVMYFALVLIATSIHVSAFVGFLIIIFKYLLKKRIRFLKLMTMTVSIALGAYIILPELIKLYRRGRYEETGHTGGITLFIVLLITILYLGCYIKQYHLGRNKDIILQYNLICCSFFIQIGALYFGILTRARFHVAVFMILLIPNLLNGNRSIANRLFYAVSVVCASWVWLFAVVHPYEYMVHIL